MTGAHSQTTPELTSRFVCPHRTDGLDTEQLASCICAITYPLLTCQCRLGTLVDCHLHRDHIGWLVGLVCA